MKSKKSKLGVAVLFAALFTTTGLAATGATIEITDPGANIVGDFYIGPYQALVNGVPTKVICDDYLADTEVNVPWSATVLSVSDLTDPLRLAETRWGAPNGTATLTTYKQAAWLALKLDAWTPSTPCFTGNCQADLQFAIWSLFDNSAYAYYQANAPNPAIWHVLAVDAWLAQAALNYNDSSIDYSSVLVYTPDKIKGGPQEFLSVKTPEPTTTMLLAVQFLGLMGIVYVVRRRAATR